jgi:hypothetical protein
MWAISPSSAPSSRRSPAVAWERSSATARASSQHAFGEVSPASSSNASSVRRRFSSTTRSVQCAPISMPLPKSVLCSSCKRTYPEGWKRCPYCGFDELRKRQEQQARRFMEKKVRDFEQRTGVSRKERPAREERGGGRGERPQPVQREQQRQRDRQRQRQQDRGAAAAPGRRQQAPEAGAAPRAPQPPQQRQQQAPQQPRVDGEQGARRRRRRRGRGGRGERPAGAEAQQQQPRAEQQPRPEQPPRPPRTPRPPRPPEQAPEGGEAAAGDSAARKRRRFRRRRKPGGGGGGEPKGE